ncbi:MAG TPA: RnfH family protein [Crenotrichaceae bacterium]|nr:RnfH family protein [Crenotrichaceae bacterium]
MLIEVAYATPEQQRINTLEVDAGTTVKQAILRSDMLDDYPEIDLSINKVGIFGEIVLLNTILHEGDRVEIYRPLQIDPRAARMKKVQESIKKA